MSTTRVVVDVPDEWLAEARAEIIEDPLMRESTHWTNGIPVLVVDVAPQPVEVTITLTPEEAGYVSSHWMDRVAGPITMGTVISASQLAKRLADALRAQGYGATPAPLPVIAEGDTFDHEGEVWTVDQVMSQTVFVRGLGGRALTESGFSTPSPDEDTPLRLALVESAREGGYAMPWDAR